MLPSRANHVAYVALNPLDCQQNERPVPCFLSDVSGALSPSDQINVTNHAAVVPLTAAAAVYKFIAVPFDVNQIAGGASPHKWSTPCSRVTSIRVLAPIVAAS
jgi:hypothetical protein